MQEQRAAVVLKLLDIMRARAKARRAAAGPHSGRGTKAGSGKFAQTGQDNVVHFPTESAQVRDEVPRQAGVSPRTASDAITQVRSPRPESYCGLVELARRQRATTLSTSSMLRRVGGPSITVALTLAISTLSAATR